MSDSALPRPARIAGTVLVWVLGAVLVLALAATAWVTVRGVLAYTHLQKAQSTALQVKDHLTDTGAASSSIASLSADTAAARRLTSDPVWRASEMLPWVGPQLSAVSTVASTIDDVASTALHPLTQVAASFSIDSLRPKDGKIDLASFTSIQSAATTAATGITSAAASIDGIDRAPLVAPLRNAVDQVGDLLDQTEQATASLTRVSALLPAMLGADGDRNYLVLFQNNAELRSLGGVPGAMALIHTHDGAMTMTAQAAATDFPVADTSVVPLGKEIVGIFGERPGRWMQNITQVPDFAITGQLARTMWANEHDGQKVDGVLSIDPIALSYLLKATGPVKLATGDTLTSNNAVSLLLNDVYKRYTDPREQDAFFAAAAASVFSALAQGNADPGALVTALTRAGDEHRLLIWSAHHDDQKLLADTTLAGGLPETDATTARFGVYLNAGTASKMDYYLRDDISVDWGTCSVSSSGEASGTATLAVKLKSEAPKDAASLPSYIAGTGNRGPTPGTIRTVVYLYLPEPVQLVDAKLSTGDGFGGGFHDGRHVLSYTVDLKPGKSATATITVKASGGVPSTLAVDATPTVVSRDTVGLSSVCK
ncbi:DUF4012 domain-containing protein [Microbacterium horticulturae]|uniref:DUF4012 domain-containing protein n=1 Tax=Microbacterium horticulturae TaxID=3028316 RepID=A0ABY8BVG2_9MICO|nr:DUF4012 domain-containing protein [Microbacterium sp. KACC 23027]WEG08169.1 DUF4012 domain-containing protein [Microbacterium sp. KACC 23027]